MAEQVKSEVPAPNSASSSSNKIERNPSKPRGSGSPFKCIGLGLVQQIKSEKDEELTQRIVELEGLAASRQKEVAFNGELLRINATSSPKYTRTLSFINVPHSKYLTFCPDIHA